MSYVDELNKLYEEGIASKIGALGVAAGLGYAAGVNQGSNVDQRPSDPKPKVQQVQKHAGAQQHVARFATDLRDMLKRHEGVERKAYKDTRGILTVGVGYNLENPSAKADLASAGINYNQAVRGASLSDQQINGLLNISMKRAVQDAQKFYPEFWSLPYEAQLVVADMSFNLGLNRLSQFKNFKAALERGDWIKAGEEMKDSRWYHQVGNRSKALVKLIQSI